MNCWILLLLLSCCGNGCGNVGGAVEDCDCRCHNHTDCGCRCHNHTDCGCQSDCESAERRAVRAVWEAKEARRDAKEAVREAKEASKDARDAVRDAREMCYDNGSFASLRGDYNFNYDNDCGCRD